LPVFQTDEFRLPDDRPVHETEQEASDEREGLKNQKMDQYGNHHDIHQRIFPPLFFQPLHPRGAGGQGDPFHPHPPSTMTFLEVERPLPRMSVETGAAILFSGTEDQEPFCSMVCRMLFSSSDKA